MKFRCTSLALALCVASGMMEAAAQKPETKCPVVIDQIALTYNHEGGRSAPQMRMWFENATGKAISTVTFSVTMLDSGGYPRPYPHDLKFRGGLESGRKRESKWDLAADSVDIHGTGETATVQKIEFADGSAWSDDGSEACTLKVDFHPR